MNKQFLRIFITLLSLTLLVLACEPASQLPSAYDQNLAERNYMGQMIQKTIYPTKTGFYPAEVITGSSPYLFIGEHSGMTSWILFRFGFRNMPNPDSSRLQSVTLTLHPSAVLGDSTTQFTATAHLMKDLNQKWDELEMKWSKFEQDYEEETLTVEPVTISALDDEPVTFDFDLSKITKADSTLDSTIITNGFCIRFEPAQNPTMIKRFHSCDASDENLKATLSFISTHNGIIDTTQDKGGHDAFIVKNEPLPGDSLSFLYLGKGVSYRSLLQFDLSFISDVSTINRAQLKLVIAHDQSLYGLLLDPNMKTYPIKSWAENAAEVAIDSSNSGITSSYDTDTLYVELRSLVQNWTSKDDTGEGFFLRSLNEGNDIERLVLYGTNADSLVQPRLIIDYTIPPEFNKK